MYSSRPTFAYMTSHRCKLFISGSLYIFAPVTQRSMKGLGVFRQDNAYQSRLGEKRQKVLTHVSVTKTTCEVRCQSKKQNTAKKPSSLYLHCLATYRVP